MAHVILSTRNCASLGVFAAACVANWVVYMFMTDLNHYFKVLSLISLFTVGLALWAVKRCGPTWTTLNMIVGGLFVSYWWALQGEVMHVLRTIVSLFPKF